MKYLIQGFRTGFDLKYKGPTKVQRTSPNLKLTVGTKTDLWNKIMTEVKAGRYAGPFAKPPFEHFVQSPVGLVPKDKGRKTRLIFHLSYPRDGQWMSINAGIPKKYCTVRYPDFADAVKICIEARINCFCGKLDMPMAFRNVPLKKTCWKLMLLKAYHPVTGELAWFLDKCLPFGSSISCKIFQDFSDAVAHIVKYHTNKPLVNYLDDYFFAALRKLMCDSQLRVFLDICEQIKFPVSLEKTEWSTNFIVFLGLLIDTVNQVVCIPAEKITKALDMVEYFFNKRNKKATVLQIQRLCGTLNFLCRCVIPGRVFTRRLYSRVSSKLKPYHHVKITDENRQDLWVWRCFLLHPQIFNRPFLDMCNLVTSQDIDIYSDASGKIGFGAYCGSSWTYSAWSKEFIEQEQPSIEFLELYAVVVGILLWLGCYPNKQILLHCDNQSVCGMINKCSSKNRNCMVLLRVLVLEAMVRNSTIKAEYVATGDNGKADALSRLQFSRFYDLAKGSMDMYPTKLPELVWPIHKVWTGVVSFTDPPVLTWTRPIYNVVNRPGVPFTAIAAVISGPPLL